MNSIGMDDLDEETKKAVELVFSISSPDGSDLDSVIDSVKDKLDKDSADMVDSLSFEDLLIAYKIENDGPMSMDELKAQIREIKDQAKEGINILVTEKWDKYQTSKQTPNKVDKYKAFAEELAAQKQAYDEGSTFSDDFKDFTALLSPNGINNPASFLKGFENTGQYFTDGTKGLDKFIENLEGLGIAEDVGSDGMKKLSINMTDLEAAAQSMGLGFESFMILMDALAGIRKGR